MRYDALNSSTHAVDPGLALASASAVGLVVLVVLDTSHDQNLWMALGGVT